MSNLVPGPVWSSVCVIFLFLTVGGGREGVVGGRGVCGMRIDSGLQNLCESVFLPFFLHMVSGVLLRFENH